MLPEPTIPERSAAPLAVARPRSKHPPDLLALSPERFQRALWRSFLRYGVGGDLDTAVHAAMTVIGPVLEARDAEITRLREAVSRVKRAGPARPARPAAPARRRAAPARIGTKVAAAGR